MAQELNGLIPQIMGSFRQAQRNPNFDPEQPVSDTNTPYKETGMWGRFLGDDSNKRNNAYNEQDLANRLEMRRMAVAPNINRASSLEVAKLGDTGADRRQAAGNLFTSGENALGRSHDTAERGLDRVERMGLAKMGDETQRYGIDQTGKRQIANQIWNTGEREAAQIYGTGERMGTQEFTKDRDFTAGNRRLDELGLGYEMSSALAKQAQEAELARQRAGNEFTAPLQAAQIEHLRATGDAAAKGEWVTGNDGMSIINRVTGEVQSKVFNPDGTSKYIMARPGSNTSDAIKAEMLKRKAAGAAATKVKTPLSEIR